ncbi:hypothetical protein ACP4OV_009795 [Aristida adscensionis]
MAPASKLPFLPLIAAAAALLLPVRGGEAVGDGAFDITKILGGFPEFSALNALLVDTDLAPVINSREKVTVLALNNTAIAEAAAAESHAGEPPGLPRAFAVDLLSLHVVLDYVDEPRLEALRRGRNGEGSVLTTLLQATRAVPRGGGLLRVASSGDGGGRITFSSAAPGGARNATFEGLVATRPYSVSVIKVSGFVVPPSVRFLQPFPPRARHMSAPPSRAPAPAPAPIGPVPTPNLTGTPPPEEEEEEGVIPIPSVHGGMSAQPSAAGHGAASSWSGLAAALGIMACLLGRL